MKEWLTAREIAAEKLPDMPTTESAVIRLADRSGWDGTSAARKRQGRGGATEYHLSLFPVLAQAAYSQRHLSVTLANDNAASAARKPAPASGVTARAGEERDARLAIVHAFKKFMPKLGYASRMQVFTDRYNAGSIEVAAFVRETVPSVSKRSLARWVQAVKAGKQLGHDPALARKGTGVLETANDGKLRAFMLGLIAHQPHLSAGEVRTICCDEFGDSIKAVSKGVETSLPMPPLRTFQDALAKLKERHKVELIKLTNPDLYRSTLAPSGIGMLRHVTDANQMWQIDASPMDALCTDGRHSIYLCLDIATRREIIFVSRTPRASAVALLIRKAILAWGVPGLIKTDNGSDFVARDTMRLFASLGIEAEKSDAYSPQQKGHVERAIRTFQHKFAPLLPGYVGHSVADRKAIESRKSFADRLGSSDAETFNVSLTGPELQKLIDQWVETVQQHEPHAGLKGGTPYQAAIASAVPVRRVDARALDLLLMPVAEGGGLRTVSKFGVRIEHFHYRTTNMMPGTVVLVRQDPHDLGRAYLFAQDGAEFLGEAFCAELAGLTGEDVRAGNQAARDEVAQRVKPIRDEMLRIAKGKPLIERVLREKARHAPNVIALPKREEAHSTAQIVAAIEAMGERLNPTRELTAREAAEHRRLIDEMRAEDEAQLHREVEAQVKARQDEIEAARVAHLPKTAKIHALPEMPKQRYARAVEFDRQLKAGTIRVEDAVWLGGYQQSPEFRAHKDLHEEFGDEWLAY